MRSLASLLIVLAACGGGAVCAGCSDPAELPPTITIHATWVSSTEGPPPQTCFTNGTAPLALTFIDTDTSAPLLNGQRRCDPVADVDGGWRIVCAEDPTHSGIDTTIGHDMSSGSVAMSFEGCTDTYAITLVE